MYLDYLRVRNTDSPDRLRLKADLAKRISEDPEFAKWYNARLTGSGKGFGDTYGDVAMALVDGENIPGRREPSLAESVIATRELQADYREIREILLTKPNVRSIIKVGSTTWGENYDVRIDHNDPSDLDLEVLVDDIDPDAFSEFPGCREALEAFLPYFLRGEAQYLSYGYVKDGRPISMHFMPTQTFMANCRRDYRGITSDVLITEFRNKPKSKPPVYSERFDGAGNMFPFHGQPILVTGGQLTQVPVMMVSPEGRIVMGLVFAKYFSYPGVDGDTEFFNSHVNRFKHNLAQRLNLEGGGDFAEMTSRKNRMPYYILDQLRAEQAQINSELYLNEFEG